MTREEILSNKRDACYAISMPFGYGSIYEAMDEYAKQQAIEFDIWKIKNHWLWDASALKYFKWEDDNKHETKLSHEDIYTRFMEQSNKK